MCDHDILTIDSTTSPILIFINTLHFEITFIIDSLSTNVTELCLIQMVHTLQPIQKY